MARKQQEYEPRKIVLPLKFERREGIVEQYRILKRELRPHDGYGRENDGTWTICDAEGWGIIRVAFCGEAKRGEGWATPDPVGQEFARLIVTAVNHHKKLLRALRSCRDMLLVLTDAQFSNPKVVDILRDQIRIAEEALEGLE